VWRPEWEGCGSGSTHGEGAGGRGNVALLTGKGVVLRLEIRGQCQVFGFTVTG
jgi:hypothetical protein